MALNRNFATEQEIQNALRSNDVEYFIRLIIDNNPDAVKDNLIQEGYQLASNPDKQDIYNSIKTVQSNEGDERIGQLLSVPYSDVGSEYTQNLRPFFAEQLADSTTGIQLLGGEDEESVWSKIGAGLGQFGRGLVGGIFSSGGFGSGGNQQPPMPVQQEEDDKILGLEKSTFWLVLGLGFVVIVGGILLTRRKSMSL